MKVLNRKVEKQDDKVIVTESVEKIYNREELIVQLTNIQMEKTYTISQSKKLKEEYDKLVQKENDIKAMLQEFQDDKFKEILE